MRDMVLGLDSNFSMDRFVTRYNSDLANDYGNLINRVTMLINKYFDGKIPTYNSFDKTDLELISIAKSTSISTYENFETMKIHEAIENIFSMIRKINQFLEIREPWKLLKSNDTDVNIAATTLYISIEILRIGTQLLHAIMPRKCKEILYILGASNISLENFDFGQLKPGDEIHISKAPFPRINL
tara:strand:- start:138 stop:692 length:555 start_codon:yes stop_codon:yes gene_type:complete